VRRPSQAARLAAHAPQANLNDAALTEPVRAFFRRVGPEEVGYYFPVGTGHTPLEAQEVWK